MRHQYVTLDTFTSYRMIRDKRAALGQEIRQPKPVRITDPDD